MAWTAPSTWVDSNIVKAAQFSDQIKGNEDYLKGELDRLTEADGSSPGRSLDTEYENTSGKALYIAVWFECSITGDAADLPYVYAEIGSSSPPGTVVARGGMKSGTWPWGVSNWAYAISFVVPPGWYYKVNKYQPAGTSLSQNGFYEWELF